MCAARYPAHSILDITNPYFIFCREITKLAFQPNIDLAPSNVFIDNINLFTPFKVGDKTYDKSWLLSKGLERYNKLLARFKIGDYHKIGSVNFTSVLFNVELSSHIEGIGMGDGKVIKGITFSPYADGRTIQWSNVHRLQWEELHRLTMKLHNNNRVREQPRLFCAYLDASMIWHYEMIDYNVVDETRMMQQQQQLVELDRQFYLGYSAPKLHCPDLNCPKYNTCFPYKADK